MNIDVLFKSGDINERALKGKTVVVFDVLRATSTIVTALANGCRAVIPVEEIAEAEEIARALKEGRRPGRADFPDYPGNHSNFDREYPGNRKEAGAPETAPFSSLLAENILLGGERGGERLPGFPHGNSPLEYTQEVVTGKVLVLTTTNGTRAIRRAARDASVLFTGSLLNARAVARELRRLQVDAVLVCAGTNGHFSLEDALAAGVVIKETLQFTGNQNNESRPEKRPGPGHPRNPRPAKQIRPETYPVNLSDSAMAVYRLALWYGSNLFRAFHDSRHGQKLLRLGLAADLEYCSRLNLFNLAPVYRKGVISLP